MISLGQAFCQIRASPNSLFSILRTSAWQHLLLSRPDRLAQPGLFSIPGQNSPSIGPFSPTWPHSLRTNRLTFYVSREKLSKSTPKPKSAVPTVMSTPANTVPAAAAPPEAYTQPYIRLCGGTPSSQLHTQDLADLSQATWSQVPLPEPGRTTYFCPLA